MGLFSTISRSPQEPGGPRQQLDQVRVVLREFRARESGLRTDATSRSTGIRNVYKGGYDALRRVEEIVSR